MRRLSVITVLALASLAASARPASADITAFIGITPTPENRSVRGFAFGFGLLILGFEFEYGSTVEDALEQLPGLRTGSGNILLQTPLDIAGMQLYATAGGGVFRERLEVLGHQETHLSTNVGGGAKIRLLGPLRVRLDYRVFRLQGNPLHQTYQRFYAGANLGF